MLFSSLYSLCRKTTHLTLILLILGLVSACTNLSGEPEIIRTLAPPTVGPTPVADAGVPVSLPDLSNGATLYAVNCTQCHGVAGAGDGQLVASGQVMNPGNFTDPLQMNEQTPRDYFNIITNGNLANLMPPWANALNEAERWSAAMFTYTLHYTSEQIENGEQIVTENELGAMVNEAYGDASDPATLVDVTEQDLIDMFAATGLDIRESRAATAYIRSLSLDSADTITGPLAQIQPTPAPTLDANVPTGTVTGTITNGSEGGTVPPNLTVGLQIFRDNTQPPSITTTADDDNTFRFEDVPILDDVLYVVSSNYEDIDFIGQATEFTGDTLDIPLRLFEVTDDPNAIQFEVVQTQLRNLPNARTVEIIQEYQFSNLSDRMFRTQEELPDGRLASLTFSLPPGAIILEEANPFFYDSENFEYIDTRPVPPGQGFQVLFAYFVPFEDAAIIEHDLLYPSNPDTGIAIVNYDPASLEVVGGGFTEIPQSAQGEDPIIPDENFITVATTLNNLNGLMQFELRADPVPIGTSADSSVVTSDNFVPVLIGALVVVLIFVGAFVLMARRQDAAYKDREDMINALVEQLNGLEAAHDAGKINHDVYQRQKTELQTRINKLNRGSREHIESNAT